MLLNAVNVGAIVPGCRLFDIREYLVMITMRPRCCR
jgi:hypothetical protein